MVASCDKDGLAEQYETGRVMRRFRPRRGPVRARSWAGLRLRKVSGRSGGWPEGWSREIESQWDALQCVCTDRASRSRLARLVERLTGYDRGARESALAELELATLLIRVGCRIRFLPESQARSADLECFSDGGRFFVEVTALVGTPDARRQGQQVRSRHPLPGEKDEEGECGGRILIHRLLARISQKARQLADYCDPVVLAITAPHRDQRVEELDLKRLAGAITVLLPLLTHVSAVMLSLWDVEPSQARSGVRLANVHIVERSVQQAAYPRVRLLAVNPAAAAPLRQREIDVLKSLL